MKQVAVAEKIIPTFAGFVHFAELGLKIQGTRLLQHESSEQQVQKFWKLILKLFQN